MINICLSMLSEHYTINILANLNDYLTNYLLYMHIKLS